MNDRNESGILSDFVHCRDCLSRMSTTCGQSTSHKNGSLWIYKLREKTAIVIRFRCCHIRFSQQISLFFNRSLTRICRKGQGCSYNQILDIRNNAFPVIRLNTQYPDPALFVLRKQSMSRIIHRHTTSRRQGKPLGWILHTGHHGRFIPALPIIGHGQINAISHLEWMGRGINDGIQRRSPESDRSSGLPWTQQNIRRPSFE